MPHARLEAALAQTVPKGLSLAAAKASGIMESLEDDHSERVLRPLKQASGEKWQSDTFNADIAWRRSRLQAVGVQQVIAIDLTREEFRIPAVKIVIPGIEAISKLGECVPGPRARRLMGQKL